MLISDAMNAKLNEQITHEFHSSHIYLAMACQFERQSLKVLANWFRLQAREELTHAYKIIDYITAQQGVVHLKAIPEPPAEYPSVEDAIKAAVEHEKKITKCIHDLVALAEKEQDFATREFLGWFVKEQVEEVDSVSQLYDAARMAGKNLLQLEAYVAHLGRED